MSGCDWQKKSFSVGCHTETEPICYVCQLPAHFRYNGGWLCGNCFNLKCPSKEIGVINTEKDKRWEYVDYSIAGQPIQITSKRQYQRLLKERNLADASIKECKQEAGFRKRIMDEDYSEKKKQNAKKIAQRLQGDGVAKDLPSFMKTYFRAKER